MLLYNFRGQIVDLSTFTEIKYFDGTIPILNDGNFYHTYNDIKNYIDGDEYYKPIEKDFNNIESFLSTPFFKIYNKITDLKIFKSLFLDIVKNADFIKAFKSAEAIQNFVLNPSVKSFLQYNRKFRNNTNKLNNDWLINWNKDFINWKENYKTFRISNSFINLSNENIKEYIDNKQIIELDIKASDYLWILLLNYIFNPTEIKFNKLKEINKFGVYNSIKSLEHKDYSERKKELLISLYSITDNTNLSNEQKNIIKELDLDNLFDYINNNKTIFLSNGFGKTVNNKLAYIGQTLTSLFLRFLVNNFFEKRYNILFSKHDSIFMVEEKDVDISVNLENVCFSWCEKDITITKKDNYLINILLKNNIKIKKI